MNIIEESIIRQRFLPIIDFSSIKSDRFFEVLLKNKIEVLQVNFHSKEQMEKLSLVGQWNKQFTNLRIGVGFIYSPEDAEAAIKGGAPFIVSSIMAKDIIHKAKALNTPAIISGLTPTEIYQAHATGEGLVQVFPASQIAPRSVVSILEHLPHMKLMVTGGLNLYESLEFLRIGVSAVGVKGSIFQKEYLETENYSAIADSIKNFRDRLQSV